MSWTKSSMYLQPQEYPRFFFKYFFGVSTLTTKLYLKYSKKKNFKKKGKKNRGEAERQTCSSNFLKNLSPLFQLPTQMYKVQSRITVCSSIRALHPMYSVPQNSVIQSDSVRWHSATFGILMSAVAWYSVLLPLFFPYLLTRFYFILHVLRKLNPLLLLTQLPFPFLFLWKPTQPKHHTLRNHS